VSAIKITKYDRLLRSYLKLKRSKNGVLTCSRCGGQYPIEDCQGLHVSHFFGRANWTVRLDEENVDFHCHGCHAYFTANPHHHTEWKMEQMGPEYNNLVMKAAKTIKDWYGVKKQFYLDDWYKETKQKLKELEDGQRISSR